MKPEPRIEQWIASVKKEGVAAGDLLGKAIDLEQEATRRKEEGLLTSAQQSLLFNRGNLIRRLARDLKINARWADTIVQELSNLAKQDEGDQ